MKKILIPLFSVFMAASSWAGATFSRITTWSSGNTLTASALNAEFQNILNNLTPAGMDDYSANTTEMRTVTDPYPASSESLATSLQGELERIRYQILEIKKSMQASNVTYWYQDLPTAGVFTIAGSSVGINDTTPDYTFDVEGGTIANSGNIVSDGNITTTGDDVDISTHVSITGILASGTHAITGTLSASSMTMVSAVKETSQSISAGISAPGTPVTFSTEISDRLSEWNGSTFTATNTGTYLVMYRVVAQDAGDEATTLSIRINGSVTAGCEVVFNTSASGTVEVMPFIGVFSLTAGDLLMVGSSTGAGDGWTASFGNVDSTLVILRLY